MEVDLDCSFLVYILLNMQKSN